MYNKVKDKYYRATKPPGFKIAKEAEPIPISWLPSLDLFVHKAYKNYWMVSEGISGQHLIQGAGSKEEAVKAALLELESVRNAGFVMANIIGSVNKHGLSPRYEEIEEEF